MFVDIVFNPSFFNVCQGGERVRFYPNKLLIVQSDDLKIGD